MQYREYGKTGKKVSTLTFGAMRLPKDHDEGVALLQYGMDLGINYIDTAMMYVDGESEIMVGKAIKGRRDKVYISSKNAISEWTNDAWRRNLDQTLTKLDTDYIDFYCVVHGMSWHAFENHFSKPNGGLEAAIKARDEGVIKHIAMSSHDSPEGIMKLIDTGIFAGMIVQYNLLDRANEQAIAHAHASGVAACIMGPVAGGRLGARSDEIAGMIETEVSSIPDLALRFVLSNPNVTTALSGMGNRQMVEENVATCSREEPLSQIELRAIRQAVKDNEKLAQLYCTGCGYCLPCPQGVAIPEIFAAMNYHRVWGLTDHAKRLYRRFGPDHKDGKQNASACVECGICELKCPQNIPIIEQLKESHEALS